MKLIWNEEDLPELAGQSADDKQAILRAAKKKGWYRRQAVALFAFGNFFVVVGAAFVFLVLIGDGFNNAAYAWAMIIGSACVLGALRRALVYRPLRRAVAEVMLHPPRVYRWQRCRDCKYDLRGSPGEKCPECGARIGVERTGWGEAE